MKYINMRTQAVIETACEIRGGNWIKLEEQPKSTPPKKKTGKKVVESNE